MFHVHLWVSVVPAADAEVRAGEGGVAGVWGFFINDMRYINPRFTYLLTYPVGVQGTESLLGVWGEVPQNLPY